jgi:hypothetical protein
MKTKLTELRRPNLMMRRDAHLTVSGYSQLEMSAIPITAVTLVSHRDSFLTSRLSQFQRAALIEIVE